MRTPARVADKSMSRDLSLYWWGQTTSVVGSVFTAVALPVIAVIHLNASLGQIGLVSAASILPLFLFSLPAGVIADRIARPRRTLIGLDALSALAVGTVALGVANHEVTIAWLVVLGVVQGSVMTLLEVIYFIHLRQLTDAAGIGPARARLQAGQYAAGLIGRLLTGPTIVVFGAASALSVDAVSYVLSAAALLRMTPVPPVSRESARESAAAVMGFLRNMSVGLKFFTSDAFHRALLISLLVASAAVSGVDTLTAPFLLRVVKVPTEAYGLLFAGSGLLGLAGSVLAGRLLRPPRDPRPLVLAAFAGAMVFGLLLPLAAGPLPVAAAIAALGIGFPVFFGAIANVALSPVIVADVAEDATGRTVAMLQALAAGSSLIGALAGGVLGDWLGVRQAMWALDVGALTAVLIFVSPAIRAARRRREASTPESAEFVHTSDSERRPG